MIFSRTMFVAYLAGIANAAKSMDVDITDKEKTVEFDTFCETVKLYRDSKYTSDDRKKAAEEIYNKLLTLGTSKGVRKYFQQFGDDRTERFDTYDAIVRRLELESVDKRKLRSQVFQGLRRWDGKALEAKFQMDAKTVGIDETRSKLSERKFPKVEKPNGVKDTIRLLQFNVLAHGLSDTGSGFSELYKHKVTVKNIEDACDKIKPLADMMRKTTCETEIEQIQKKIDEIQKPLLKDDKKTALLFRTFGKKGNAFKRKDHNGNNIWKNIPISPRLMRVMGLILKENPDIITLQELDEFDRFKSYLANYDYEGIFLEKNGNRNAAAAFNGGVYDGCAIFWDKNKIETIGIEEGRPMPNWNKESTDNRCQNDTGAKQVVLSQEFKMKESGEQFRVFTVHAKSGKDPEEFGDKAVQARFMAEELYKYKDERVILAGDFNFDKDDEAFKLFHKGEPWQIENHDEGTQTVKLSTPKAAACNFMSSSYDIEEGFEKATACKWRKGGTQKKKIKNKLDEKHTIDFIFHSKESVKTRRTLPVPTTKETLKRTKAGKHYYGLPNWCYPSDHYALCADLDFYKLKKEKSNRS